MPNHEIKITISPDGNVKEEVLGASGHVCQRITQPIEQALGEVIDRKHSAAYFITDSNPNEERIQLLEEQDWRGCCNGFMCEFGL
tara:strand:- start:2366 stop:2620 length:255 start_codon:yes stop_codon:yes gene_type:complete